MTLLLTFGATSILLDFLQAELPAQIISVNADTPAETPLTDFATYAKNELTHMPETPALVLLPQQLNLANEGPGAMETSTDFAVLILVGGADEAEVASAMQRYVAALARCVASTRTGTPIPSTNGASLYWGTPIATFSPIWTAPPNAGGSGFYQDCHLNLSLLIGETT